MSGFGSAVWQLATDFVHNRDVQANAERTMTQVTFKAEGQTVEGRKGDSLLDLALDNDIEMEHNCGGVCACTTCHVWVLEGAQYLSEMEEDEEERLDRAEGLTPKSRLGCQAKVTGEGSVVVEIRGETQEWRKATPH